MRHGGQNSRYGSIRRYDKQYYCCEPDQAPVPAFCADQAAQSNEDDERQADRVRLNRAKKIFVQILLDLPTVLISSAGPRENLLKNFQYVRIWVIVPKIESEQLTPHVAHRYFELGERIFPHGA